MVKEAKPMLQNLNSHTPTSQKLQLLPSPSLKTIAAVSGDESQSSDDHQLQKGGNTSEGAKEEDRPMSCSFKDGSKAEESGRERLKKHRSEVAGQVWVPDIWGQENFLQDWIDCSGFDSVPKEIISARAALVEEGRRAHSGRLPVENSLLKNY